MRKTTNENTQSNENSLYQFNNAHEVKFEK